MYLSKYPEHVDIRKVDDGHTSLMIAAVNNYQDVVYLLASKVCKSCATVVVVVILLSAPIIGITYVFLTTL